MKLRKLFCLIFTALLLCGCQRNGQNNADSWAEAPPLIFGKLSYEKLSVIPWSSGRMDYTSQNRMAETQLGYYFLNSGNGLLYYADKTDLSHWVAVCSKPDCAHLAHDVSCDAYLNSNTFLFKDGRIFFSASLDCWPELLSTQGHGYGLFSKSANCQNTQLEYVVKDALFSGGGAGADFLSRDQWFYNIAKINADGSYTGCAYRVTDAGIQTLYEGTVDGPYAVLVGPLQINGDICFTNAMLGNQIYRVENNSLISLNIAAVADTGRYLSGDVLRIFRSNDGYYDRNIQTGGEVHLSDAQLQNSNATVLLPNCIIETTLMSPSWDGEGAQNMVIFDGEGWHNVQLPAELRNAPADISFGVAGISSDSIFFTADQRDKIAVYRIPLGLTDYVMEYCGQFGE